MRGEDKQRSSRTVHARSPLAVYPCTQTEASLAHLRRLPSTMDCSVGGGAGGERVGATCRDASAQGEGEASSGSGTKRSRPQFRAARVRSRSSGAAVACAPFCVATAAVAVAPFGSRAWLPSVWPQAAPLWLSHPWACCGRGPAVGSSLLAASNTCSTVPAQQRRAHSFSRLTRHPPSPRIQLLPRPSC